MHITHITVIPVTYSLGDLAGIHLEDEAIAPALLCARRRDRKLRGVDCPPCGARAPVGAPVAAPVGLQK